MSVTNAQAGTAVGVWVHGLPGPKGSLSRGRYGGAYNTSKVGRAWQEKVATEAIIGVAAMPPDPPYWVSLTFYWPAPKRPTYGWPVRADIDKVARATLDGLVLGGLLTDDKHVTCLSVRDEWATPTAGPGCQVVIQTDARF